MIRFCIDINDTYRALTNQYAIQYAKNVVNPNFNIDKLEYSEQNFYSPFPFKNDKQKEIFQFELAPFEIYGAAKTVDKDFVGIFNIWLNNLEHYINNEDIEISLIATGEYNLAIQATYFFLSKTCCRVRKVTFPKFSSEIWDNVDILVTASPVILETKPEDKTIIKINMPYNTERTGDYNYDTLVDFIADEKTWKELLKLSE